MSNLKKVFLYVVFCSFLIAPAVYAEDDMNPPAERSDAGHQWREKAGEKLQEIYGQLNLTDEQKKQLEENKAKNRDKMKAVFEQMKSYKEQINQELTKAELDMAKINGIQAQLKSLQAQMADDRLSSILEVRKILTPEQFSKFLSLMEERKQKRSMGEK